MTRAFAILILLFTALPSHAVNEDWNPHIGVLRPAFGITNSHWIYTNAGFTFDYGSGAEAYRVNAHGPYTHYVDKYHGSATDTDNTYGTPDAPRLTIPYPLPAGAAVQLIGSSNGAANPYTYNDSGPGNAIWIDGNGSATAPIFVYGVTTNNAHRPWFGGSEMTIAGNWMLVEDVCFTNVSCASRIDLKNAPVTNLCIREFYAQGSGLASGPSFMSFTGESDTAYSRDILIWRGTVTRFGEFDKLDYEDDECAIINGEFSTNTWFLDCVVDRLGGDAIRVGENVETETPITSWNHFIAGLTVSSNKENAVDVKHGGNVVVSSCDFGYFPGSPTDSGAAIVIHYYPTNIVVINNRIHDCQLALYYNSSVSDTNLWVIGNEVFNTVVDSLTPDDGSQITHLHHNTIANSHNGIVRDSGTSALNISGNISYNITNHHLRVTQSGARAASTVRNECYFTLGGGALALSWGTVFTSVAELISGTSIGDNSIQADPLFTDADNRDFSLTENSPCRDAGDNSWLAPFQSVYETTFGVPISTMVDLAGTTRSGTWDIGALEFVAAEPAEPTSFTTYSPFTR